MSSLQTTVLTQIKGLETTCPSYVQPESNGARILIQAPLIPKSPNLYSARSNQSILKEINPECLLEGLMLKLKLQYCGHLMGLIGKDPDAEKDGRQKEERTTEDEMVGWHH